MITTYRDTITLYTRIMYALIAVAVVLLFIVINLILRRRDLKAELDDYRSLGYSSERRQVARKTPPETQPGGGMERSAGRPAPGRDGNDGRKSAPDHGGRRQSPESAGEKRQPGRGGRSQAPKDDRERRELRSDGGGQAADYASGRRLPENAGHTQVDENGRRKNAAREGARAQAFEAQERKFYDNLDVQPQTSRRKGRNLPSYEPERAGAQPETADQGAATRPQAAASQRRPSSPEGAPGAGTQDRASRGSGANAAQSAGSGRQPKKGSDQEKSAKGSVKIDRKKNGDDSQKKTTAPAKEQKDVEVDVIEL